ncbi:MAG: hypothetical protein Q8P91_02175 [bacterium]|nr:hypothetical protein [bacterium]
MSKKGVILSVLGVLVLLGSLALGVLLVKRNQDIRERAAPASLVSIAPASQQKSAGSAFSFSVEMDTGENRVLVIDLALSFDPQIFEITDVVRGAGASNLNQEASSKVIDNTSGKITWSIFTIDKTKAINGSGISIFIVSGNIKSTAPDGSYQFGFLPQMGVFAESESGVNVLINKIPGTVTVSGGSATPLPSPSGQATPTPTSTPTTSGVPTGSPTPTTSGVPTGSPTPTPSGVPTGSPTATPLPSPSGQATPTPVVFPVPESGISSPTLIMAGAGAFVLILSLLALIL